MILDQQSVAFMLAILEGKPGAGDVLNDYLEENGRDRVVADGSDSLSDSGRVSLILNDVLPDKIARRIVSDFAEHAIAQVELDHAQKKAGKQLIKNYRNLLDGAELGYAFSEQDLIDKANSFLALTWGTEATPKARAAWSVWAMVMGKPSNAAVSAQAVGKDELVWQLDYLNKQLIKLAD